MHKPTLMMTLAGLLAGCIFSASAYADVFKKEDLIVFDRSAVAGGQGEVKGLFSFKRDAALPAHAIKEIGWLTINPGDSIGYHKHENNEDAYIIVSGEGTFKDTDGNEYAVKAGDITIVRGGQSHGLTNTGTEPLVLLDVIAQK